MKLKQFVKDAWPVLGMIAFAIWITVVYLTAPGPEIIETIDTQCQQGWIKYELEFGTICSKTELTPDQLAEFGK